MNGGKRLAARAFRRSKDVLGGSFYKKVYNSYDVVDYIFLAGQREKRAWKRHKEIGRFLRRNKGTPDLWDEFINTAYLKNYFCK